MRPPPEIDDGFGSWEEWHYRHEFFWAATIRWVVAVLAVAALPYTSSEVRTFFGLWTVAFPAFACILGVVAFVHLLAEHARALYVRWHVGYREREREFLHDRTGVKTSSAQILLRRPIRWRIGPYIFAALSLAFFSLTGLNLLVFYPSLAEQLSKAPSSVIGAVLQILGWIWIASGFIVAGILIVRDQVHYTDAEGKPVRKEPSA